MAPSGTLRACRAHGHLHNLLGSQIKQGQTELQMLAILCNQGHYFVLTVA